MILRYVKEKYFMKNIKKSCFIILILIIAISVKIYAENNIRKLPQDVKEKIRENRILNSLSKEEIET